MALCAKVVGLRKRAQSNLRPQRLRCVRGCGDHLAAILSHIFPVAGREAFSDKRDFSYQVQLERMGSEMTAKLARILTDEELKSSVEAGLEAARAGDNGAVEAAIAPLLKAKAVQRDAAKGLIAVLGEADLPRDKVLEIFAGILEDHSDDIQIVSLIGDSLEAACEIQFLNRPPPDHDMFQTIIATLSQAAASSRGAEAETGILCGLGNAARLTARQNDHIAEAAYARLLELDASKSSRHYSQGLFYKTRGRFHEGMLANIRAAELLEGSPDQAVQWNLGICATGAGDAELALKVWQRMGMSLKMGRFDLPEGRFAQCKVRLAERPLAERSANDDDPGLEETIWIERLSPCHGVVRSVLYQQLGVDYGDVVLIDGAPITYQKYGDKEIPIFPHLATLKRCHYQFHDFAGTQDQSRAIANLSKSLPNDAIVYSHSESVVTLCANCWEDRDRDHSVHSSMEKHVVVGRIAASQTIEASDLLMFLDAAVARSTSCHIYSPSLCRAAGEAKRGDVEERRFAMIRNTID
jgi:hypothetical protein